MKWACFTFLLLIIILFPLKAYILQHIFIKQLITKIHLIIIASHIKKFLNQQHCSCLKLRCITFEQHMPNATIVFSFWTFIKPLFILLLIY